MKGNPRKNAPQKTYDLTKPVFDLEEASAFLQISTRTLKGKVASGEVPGKKVGREWRFSRTALEQMLSLPN